jgi:hypothetical protein
MKIGRKTVAEWVKDNETAPYPTPDASERYLKGEYILLLAVSYSFAPIFLIIKSGRWRSRARLCSMPQWSKQSIDELENNTRK